MGDDATTSTSTPTPENGAAVATPPASNAEVQTGINRDALKESIRVAREKAAANKPAEPTTEPTPPAPPAVQTDDPAPATPATDPQAPAEPAAPATDGQNSTQPGGDTATPELVKQAEGVLGLLRRYQGGDLNGMADDAKLVAATEYAHQTLKRSKYPDDVIEKLPQADLLDIAQSLTTRELNAEKVASERNLLRELVAEVVAEETGGKPTTSKDPDAADPAPAAGNLPSDFEKVIDEALQPLKDDGVNDDLVDPIRKAFLGLATLMRPEGSATEATPDAIKAIEERFAESENQMALKAEEAEIRAAAGDPNLHKQFPQLADPNVRAERMEELIDMVYSLHELGPEGYTRADGTVDFPNLVRRAALVTLDPQDPIKTAQAQIATASRDAHASNGEPAASAASAEPAKAMSAKDKMKLAYRMRSEGKTEAEIRAAIK